MSNHDFIEPAASIEFQLSQKSLHADGQSKMKLTIIAKDRFGKLVLDDAEVFWRLERGLGELVEKEEETKNGRAAATLVSCGFSGEMIVSAQVDDLTASVTIPVRDLKITLIPESASLSTGPAANSFPSQTRVTAATVDEDGTPVADGTKINWFVSAGTFEKGGASAGNVIETEFRDGRASVWVNAQGARAGSVLFCVAVTSLFRAGQLQFVAPPGLAVTTDHRVLAGDALADGTREVERLHREPFQAPFYTTAKFTVRGGAPNKPAKIHLAGEGAGYVELGGDDVIELDADGNGCFQLKSNGTYQKGDTQFYLVFVTVSQGQNQATVEVRVGSANGYALVYDLGHLLPWKGLNGGAAAAEFAEGMIFGTKTPLDLALRLQMFAGTEKTVFASMEILGIFSAHLGSKPSAS
jgi:hypothetical protein